MIPISDPDLHQRRFPFVNVTFIGLNALVFLYELALGSDRLRFVYTFGLIPAELTTGANFNLLPTQQGPLDITTPWPPGPPSSPQCSCTATSCTSAAT